jgi:hypothetical protein
MLTDSKINSYCIVENQRNKDVGKMVRKQLMQAQSNGQHNTLKAIQKGAIGTVEHFGEEAFNKETLALRIELWRALFERDPYGITNAWSEARTVPWS